MLHLVSGARIRTLDLPKFSLLLWPLDQGTGPSLDCLWQHLIMAAFDYGSIWLWLHLIMAAIDYGNHLIKKWANPGLFLFIFVLFVLQFQYKLKKA